MAPFEARGREVEAVGVWARRRRRRGCRKGERGQLELSFPPQTGCLCRLLRPGLQYRSGDLCDLPWR